MAQHTQKFTPKGAGHGFVGFCWCWHLLQSAHRHPVVINAGDRPGTFRELSGSAYLRALGKCSMILYRHITKHLPNSKLTQTHRNSPRRGVIAGYFHSHRGLVERHLRDFRVVELWVAGLVRVCTTWCITDVPEGTHERLEAHEVLVRGGGSPGPV